MRRARRLRKERRAGQRGDLEDGNVELAVRGLLLDDAVGTGVDQLQKDRGSLDHGVREGVVVDAALQQVLHGNHDLTDVFGGLVDGDGNVLLGGDSRIVDHEMLA